MVKRTVVRSETATTAVRAEYQSDDTLTSSGRGASVARSRATLRILVPSEENYLSTLRW